MRLLDRMKARNSQRFTSELQPLIILSLTTFGALFVAFKLFSTSNEMISVELSQARPLDVKREPPTLARHHWRGKKRMYVETITHSPRILVARNFLTDDECEHLIKAGIRKGMDVALITPYGTDKLVPSSSRTNTAAWLNFRHDPVVSDIEERIAGITGTTPAHGENMQILHYKDKTQQFTEHRDYSDPDEGDPVSTLEVGGNRMATVVVYLKTPEEGGETYFTRLGLKVKPRRGDALVFWNLKPDGQVDPFTYHAGLPPRLGEKWVATKWIHERPYQRPSDVSDVVDAEDAGEIVLAEDGRTAVLP